MKNKKLYMVVYHEAIDKDTLHDNIVYTNINKAINMACELNKDVDDAISTSISTNQKKFKFPKYWDWDYNKIETTNKTFIKKRNRYNQVLKLMDTYEQYRLEYFKLDNELWDICSKYRANYYDPLTVKYAFKNNIHEHGVYGIIELKIE